MSNLLVVDWDFFFRNPMESGEHEDDEYWLYDWGHSESNMYINGFVWPSRAYGFQKSKLELPTVDVPPNFWDRFKLHPDAVLYTADSNAYAGLLYDQNGDPFTDVWLFDAHHDLYKLKTEAEVAKWHMKGDFTCENWMFKHLVRGSQLHWRYPQWHQLGPSHAEDVPDFVRLDAAYDDGKPMDVEFDTAFVCRSGAWVPPWCDEQFIDFIDSAPTMDVEQMDDAELIREGWQEMMDKIYASWSDAEEKATKGN